MEASSFLFPVCIFHWFSQETEPILARTVCISQNVFKMRQRISVHVESFLNSTDHKWRAVQTRRCVTYVTKSHRVSELTQKYHLCCNIHLKSAKPPRSVFNWCLILLLVNLRSNLNKKIVLLFPLKCTTALKEKMNQYFIKEAIVKRVRKKQNRIWIEEIHLGTSPILFNRIWPKEGLNQEHLSLH